MDGSENIVTHIVIPM